MLRERLCPTGLRISSNACKTIALPPPPINSPSTSTPQTKVSCCSQGCSRAWQDLNAKPGQRGCSADPGHGQLRRGRLAPPANQPQTSPYRRTASKPCHLLSRFILRQKRLILQRSAALRTPARYVGSRPSAGPHCPCVPPVLPLQGLWNAAAEVSQPQSRPATMLFKTKDHQASSDTFTPGPPTSGVAIKRESPSRDAETWARAVFNTAWGSTSRLLTCQRVLPGVNTSIALTFRNNRSPTTHYSTSSFSRGDKPP